MFDNFAGHDHPAEDELMSDSALLEDALVSAVDAHTAGLLLAPFGVDELTLSRARRRALRSDLRRLAGQFRIGQPSESA